MTMRHETRATLAAVLGMPDVDPETICRVLAMTPTAIACALHQQGRTDLARPFWRLKRQPRRTRSSAETLAEVQAMAAESPDEVCRRLGVTPAAVARAMYRCGRPELARPFQRLQKRDWSRQSARRREERAAARTSPP